MEKIKVGVMGATGYAGQQLVSLLVNHPNVEISFLSSNSYAGKMLSEIYPAFQDFFDIQLISTVEAKETIPDIDVLFTALPNGLVFDIAQIAVEQGKKIVDFSPDFRLDCADVYEEWYNTEHTAKNLIPNQVYGLPELWREKLRGASLVANPGCYTTASILALAPLLAQKDLVDTKHLIIDAKSGITGAGRKADLSLLYSEAGESIKAYGIARHRHTPEIEQELSKVYGKPVMVQFTPHLMPMKRGILATIYADLIKPASEEEIYALYDEFYRGEKFIRMRKGICETRFVVHTNYCDISIKLDERTQRLVITSAIDNLMKGAASQAVQNMNIICGLKDGAGLNFAAPIIP